MQGVKRRKAAAAAGPDGHDQPLPGTPPNTPDSGPDSDGLPRGAGAAGCPGRRLQVRSCRPAGSRAGPGACLAHRFPGGAGEFHGGAGDRGSGPDSARATQGPGDSGSRSSDFALGSTRIVMMAVGSMSVLCEGSVLKDTASGAIWGGSV